MKMLIPIVLATMFAGNATAADIYKCPTAAGKVEFRDTPCQGAAGEKIKAKDNSAGQGDSLADIRAKTAEFNARHTARQDAADKASAAAYAAQQRAFLEERRHQESVDLTNAIREGNSQRAADRYNSHLVRQPERRVRVEIVNPPSKAPPTGSTPAK